MAKWATISTDPEGRSSRRLSRSLLIGLPLLASFPPDGSYVGIAELARMSGRSPSTTHRYVSALVAVGLLERDGEARRYRRVQ
jgi:DNA-binding IclR family transcriptional regulator